MLPAASEWLLIFFVAVLVFGPSKLPQLGKAIGEFLNEFKKGIGANPGNKDSEDVHRIRAESEHKDLK